MDGRVVGRRPAGEVGEVTGEPQVAVSGRSLGTSEQGFSAAGEFRDRNCQVGVGGGLQPAGSSIPPAAELAPHTAHHELGLVI